VIHKILILFICFTGIVTEVFSQPPDNPDPIPIDSGIVFLIAAAIGYGIIRIKRQINKK